MCNYTSKELFMASAFYNAFPACGATGSALEVKIEGFVEAAQAAIDAYLPNVCERPRKETYRGDNSDTYFVQNLPIVEGTDVTIQYRQRIRNKMNSYYNNLDVYAVTGTIRNFYVEDYETGLIRSEVEFDSRFMYTFNYTSGYASDNIPNELTFAANYMVLNLAQRIDNMQLNSPDMSLDSIKVDKSVSTSYSQSKYIKQVVLRSVKDLNELPIPVMKILDKYKYDTFI